MGRGMGSEVSLVHLRINIWIGKITIRPLMTYTLQKTAACQKADR